MKEKLFDRGQNHLTAHNHSIYADVQATQNVTDVTLSSYISVNDLYLFGHIFENMVLRDLLMYAQSHNATVMHYTDDSGLEDAVAEIARMEQAEEARKEQEKLSGKTETIQKMFRVV